MQLVLLTPNRGLILNPDQAWDGSKAHKFCILGHADSNYVADTDDRQSVSGACTYVEDSPVVFCSATQKFITLHTLSVTLTEAEPAAGVTCVQGIMYVYHMLKSLRLDVEVPTCLEIDNIGAVNMANN